MKHKKSSAALFLLVCVTHLAAAPLVDLQLHSQDSIHRVRVPGQLLVECQTAGFENIHVIDGAGKNMSMARISAKKARTVLNTTTAINAVYPLWDRQALPDRSALRVIEQQGLRSLEWNTVTSSETSQRKQRGVLLDSRLFDKDHQAVQLILSADIPESEMIPVQIDISKDLKRWQPLHTDAFLGRWHSEDGNVINKMSIDLPYIALNEHFIRLRWDEALAGEIVIHRAEIISEQQQNAAPPQERIELGAPQSKTMQGKQALIWQFNPPLAIDALQLSTQTLGTNVAVQLQGRVSSESPWRTLSHGSVMHVQYDGKTHNNQPLRVSKERWQALQVLTTGHNAVWPSDMTAVALVPLQQLAFLAQGHAPYRLTCTNQENTWLQLAQLIPGYQQGHEDKLPEASFSLDEPVTPAALQSQSERPPYLLWAILAAGVVVLAAMLIIIIRQLKTTAKDDEQ